MELRLRAGTMAPVDNVMTTQSGTTRTLTSTIDLAKTVHTSPYTYTANLGRTPRGGGWRCHE